jgi:precorrin-3B synthase
VHQFVGDHGVDAVAGVVVEWVDPGLLDRATPQPRAPIGVHRSRREGDVFVGAAPVLGRLDAAALDALGDLADRYGDGTVRLTPWRSVLVPGVQADRGPALLAELAGLGLVTDPADPALSVVACVGSAGCAAGLADTLADARSLIADLRRAGTSASPSIHVSGCAKRCASRATYDVTLVAVGPGRYRS